MKRLLGGFFALIFMMGFASVANAGVNDFKISSYDIQYNLSRDSYGRSTLETVEKITAEFPAIDQNHGIERAIPTKYDDHSVSLEVISIADENGRGLAYSTSDSNDNRVLRIGNANEYVHGSKTYVIKYVQRDVTKFFTNTDRIEWYWDTNGTHWRVPITKLSVTVRFDDSIIDKMTGDNACYQGYANSINRCGIQIIDKGLLNIVANNLGPGENVTLAIGFQKSAFGEYEPSTWERIWGIIVIINIVLSIVALFIAIWLIIKFNRVINRSREMGTIVPEYLPPLIASVTTSARVGGLYHSVMTAQLLDLAVRHYIKIHEVKEKTLFKPAEYEVEVVRNIDALRWEERELLKDTFGKTPAVGDRYNLKQLRNNARYLQSTLNNDSDLDKLIRGEYGFRHKDDAARAWFRRTGSVLMTVGLFTLSVGLLFVGAMAFIVSFFLWTLTDEGLALRRYLNGLKLYISVAEEERLKMLQGPETAEKISSVANGTDASQLVKLYERVLPYAVLFDQEQDWNKQLGHYYEVSSQQPDWYVGRAGAFNAAAFTSAMTSFSSSNSYISSTSSSSGGSGGGGSSGGGGGGGGGGGW